MTKTTRPNYTQTGNKFHDPRRLLKHQAKNCECCICYRELAKLPPMQTQQEEFASYKFEEREIKQAKKNAKREVRQGKQATINTFFQLPSSDSS
jgi:hypothetical protein